MSNRNNHNLTPDKELINRRRPRICMLTQRNFAHNAFRCGFYESQDVLSDVDDVDLLYLKPGKAYELRDSFQRKIIRHDFSRQIVSAAVPIQPIRLTREYDLFIAYFPLIKDLPQISAVQGWKDCCGVSICWIDECWLSDVSKYKFWLPVLNDFDYVMLGLNGTVKTVSDIIKRPCHFIPGGVDAIRFSPYPSPPDRVIDIYSIGRMWEAVHNAFLDIAAKKEMFYVYDTFLASDTKVIDHRRHREMLANVAKRSRYFFVAPAKMDMHEETRGQIEFGFRYYEASAAGAVMLGQTPDSESFRTMFNWPDAVIEIQPDGSDVADVLESLVSQTKRLSEISRRNATEALLRHDWVYRWEKILNIVGLKPTPELEIRENRLKQIAERVGNKE